MILNEEFQFQELLAAIRQHRGLDCRQYKVNYLKRRLAIRMRATNSKSYLAYRQYLQTMPEEYDLLLDRLTINVSNFFRDAHVYVQIDKLLLPQWKGFTRVNIWSAGCANGEEPYSLAMLLMESMPKHCHWQILATDVDPLVVQTAQLGRYKNEYLKALPQVWKTRYFEPLENGAFWQAHPELKRHIRFEVQDLTHQLPEERFNLIMCRNVLIYFISELQERLFKGFYEILEMDGFMVLGKTETLLGDFRGWFNVIDLRERIFQKKLKD